MIIYQLKRSLRQLLIILLLIVGIVGGIGLLIYALFRVATFSKSVYAIIFYIALCALVVFYVYRGIHRKLLSTILIKIARVGMKIIVIICIISAIMLWGAFVLRFPIVGGSVTPFLIVLLVIAGLKFKFFSFFKKL